MIYNDSGTDDRYAGGRNARTGIRDRALLMLLYNTGARVSEVVGIKAQDLHLQGSPHVTLLGKGKKHRNCPLWSETAQALQAYLKCRDPKDPATEQLFLNTNGAPVTRFGIGHITRKYAVSARSQCPSLKTKIVSPHTLRHTTAMHLLRASNDIKDKIEITSHNFELHITLPPPVNANFHGTVVIYAQASYRLCCVV